MASKTAKPTMDSPSEGYNGSNGPGEALKMPTKHYPSSSKLGEKRQSVIEGPCDDCKEGYHK